MTLLATAAGAILGLLAISVFVIGSLSIAVITMVFRRRHEHKITGPGTSTGEAK